MWNGSSLLTRSAANNLRKSCGVKQAVRKPGWRSASSSQRPRSMFTTVAGQMTSWFGPILRWNRNGIAELAWRSRGRSATAAEWPGRLACGGG
jgi:hypothetical protein